MVDQINNPTDPISGQTLFQNQPVANDLSNLYTSGGAGGSCFPSDLSKQGIWMSFSFYQYQRPQFNNIGHLQDQGTIRLPIPNNLVDTSSMEYTQEALGTVAGAALNSLSGGGGLKEVGSDALKGLGVGAGAKLADILGAGVAGASGASATATQMLGQQVGVAVNPFLTVMFKQPSFKRHAFLWRLTPSNLEESNALNTIIKGFKFNQLPDMAESMGGTLLTYPNIVQVTLSNYNENYFSYTLKPAVIETLSVNYAPSSTPSFFGATKSPTEIEIRMTLLEITMWLQRDYGKPNTSGLGVNYNTLVSAFQ